MTKTVCYKINALNSGSIQNSGIGPQGPKAQSFIMEKRPQSGPSKCNAAKGWLVANHFVKSPISGI